MDPRRTSLALPALLALAGATGGLAASADPEGLEELVRGVARVLPGKEAAQERKLGAAGAALGFGASLRAVRHADALLTHAAARSRPLARSLAGQGTTAAAGPTHRALEAAHVLLAETRADLLELADAVEDTARAMDPAVGSGDLVGALALEEVLARGHANLRGAGRSIRVAAGECARARRALSRMLAFVEEVQDRDLSRSRDRVLLSSRRGATDRLARGLEAMAGWLDASRKDLDKVRGLMRVRYLSLIEALRNLSAHQRRAGGLAGLGTRLDSLESARATLLGRLELLEARQTGRARGEVPLPELPALPRWLFFAGRPGEAPPPAPPGAAEALDLLDELERDIDAETQTLEDPVTAMLARTFEERHGIFDSDAESDPSGL